MSNKMEIVFVLDCSGSMGGCESDVIGGFNRMIKDQREREQEALVTTVLFNTSMRDLHDRVPLAYIESLTNKDYCPNGCTALLDAVGETIKRIKTAHRYARKEDLPLKTLFVVMTDGEENSSQFYSNEQIQTMVKQQEEEHDWEFVFIGADIDAFASARNLGIREERAVSFSKADDSFEDCFDSVSEVSYRISRCAHKASLPDEAFADLFKHFGKKKK